MLHENSLQISTWIQKTEILQNKTTSTERNGKYHIYQNYNFRISKTVHYNLMLTCII